MCLYSGVYVHHKRKNIGMYLMLSDAAKLRAQGLILWQSL